MRRIALINRLHYLVVNGKKGIACMSTDCQICQKRKAVRNVIVDPSGGKKEIHNETQLVHCSKWTFCEERSCEKNIAFS